MFVPPLFVNRMAGDYHLSAGSTLINQGSTNSSIPHDIEGDVRIFSPDIGADEFVSGHLFLPLILRNYVTGPGD